MRNYIYGEINESLKQCSKKKGRMRFKESYN